jgi:hypothetical protein
MIKDILNLLSADEKKLIREAFDSETPCMIKLPNNEFIGVHLTQNDGIKILQQAGAWSHGKIL